MCPPNGSGGCLFRVDVVGLHHSKGFTPYTRGITLHCFLKSIKSLKLMGSEIIKEPVWGKKWTFGEREGIWAQKKPILWQCLCSCSDGFYIGENSRAKFCSYHSYPALHPFRENNRVQPTYCRLIHGLANNCPRYANPNMKWWCCRLQTYKRRAVSAQMGPHQHALGNPRRSYSTDNWQNHAEATGSPAQHTKFGFIHEGEVEITEFTEL